MYVRREVCSRETGKAPIKTAWAETDKGHGSQRKTKHTPDPSFMRRHRRWRRWKSCCRRSQQVSVKERYWHWSTCGGRTSALSNCRPRTTSRVTNTCGLLRYSLYGTRGAAQDWEEELASTLSGHGLTRGSACLCVWRGRIKRAGSRGDRARRRRYNRWATDGRRVTHQDDIQEV